MERTCAQKLGMQFDPWQKDAGRLVLAKRENGLLAHTIGGVGMSLPRQVGKTYLFMGIFFALCIEIPDLLFIWTAHHSRTSSETFLTMKAFAESYEVKPYIEQVFLGSGVDQEIRFVNNSRILFGAREKGFGRGIPGVDGVMMDEGQILSELAMQNILATMNTSRFGLHCYVGTPPKPEEVMSGKAEVFTRMREECLDGESDDMVWIEFSADENANPDKREQWAKANPSFPHRTPVESILRMRKKLDDDGFCREALGIWDSTGRVFDLKHWASAPLLNREAEQPDRVVLTIAVSPDRKRATIGAASQTGDGRKLVICETHDGTHWVVPKVLKLISERVVDDIALAGPAGKVFESELTEQCVEFFKINGQDMGAACGAFQEAVKSSDVCHVGQPELDLAVANARVRMSGELQQWDRRDNKVDDSPLVACSAAYYRLGIVSPPLVIL